MLWCFASKKSSNRHSSVRKAESSTISTPVEERPRSTNFHDSADFDEERTEFDFDQKREMVLDHSNKQQQPQQQQQNGVEFSISLDPQPLRLMELPPQLLDEIEQLGTTLQLKSLNGDVGNSVVLCSATQTFAVRQNQSSNSLFVTETATGGSSSNNAGETFLRAMAQPKGMLEISPSKPDGVAYLRGVLPVLQKEHLHPDSGRLLPGSPAALSPSRTGYDECLRSAPFSRGEFADACEQVCAFEFEGLLWLPAPALALDAWKAILDGVVENANARAAEKKATGAAGAADEVRRISFTLPEIGAVLVERNLPGELYRAVTERTCSFLEQEATLEPDEYAPWTGATLLNVVGGAGLPVDAFMDRWRDCLPLGAHPLASLELLKGKYELSDDGATITKAGLPKKAPVANGTASKTHKWHEKFRASRK